MNEDLVSVIIPTYGRPVYLGRAIRSVLSQSYKNIELIVVDDNPEGSESRAATEKLMREFSAFESIVYIRHPKNRRVAAARNTGIQVAKGNFISFLDDDDEYSELKIEAQVDFLKSKKGYAACYCRFESFSNGKMTRRSTYREEGDLTLDVYTFKCTGNASCYMFRREVLVCLGGFNEALPRHEDFELLIRFFKSWIMGFVDYTGVIRHTDSRINMPPLNQYAEIKKVFFDAVNDSLNSLSRVESSRVLGFHRADVFFYAVRQKELSKSIALFPGFLNSARYLWVKFPNIVEIVKRRYS